MREEYLRERKIRRQRLRAINAQQWAEEEKELKSRQESADPEFAILVCGYGERYDGRKVAISKVPTLYYLFLCFMLSEEGELNAD